MGKRKVKKDVPAANESDTTKTVVTPKATEEKGSESATLTIADLQAQSRIFQLASTRGAFHANELSVVGAVFDKLNGFLRQVEDTQKAAAGDDDGNAEDTGSMDGTITTGDTATDETVSTTEEA